MVLRLLLIALAGQSLPGMHFGLMALVAGVLRSPNEMANSLTYRSSRLPLKTGPPK